MIHFQKLFLAIWMLPVGVFAQNHPIIQYTIRDGLSQMQCMNIFQDSRGFVWVSTKGGLNRFDGEEFKTFKRKDGLFSNYSLGGITETQNGDIYIQNGYGLVRFDGQKIDSIPYPKGYMGRMFKSLFKNKKDEIYVFGQNGGNEFKDISILKYDQSYGFKKLYFPELSKELKFVPHYFDLKTGRWYGFAYHHKMNLIKDCYFLEKGKYTKLAGTYDNNVFEILEINNSSLILQLMNKEGIFEQWQETTTGTFTKWLEFKKNGEINQKFDLPVDQMFRHGSHFYSYNSRNKKIEKITAQDYHVNDFVLDRNGQSYWLATEKGLLFFPNNGIRHFEEKNAPLVWSVAENADGSYFFLGYGTALKKFQNGQISEEKGHLGLFPFKHSSGSLISQSQASSYYYKPFLDKFGKTWLPNTGSLLNFDGKNFSRINANSAFYLLNDEENNLIIQCSATGIYLIENRTGYPTQHLEPGKDLIPYPNYMLAFKDHKKRYWLGGWGGINRFENIADLKAKKSKEYSRAQKNIPFRALISLLNDQDGNIWIGTIDGLYLYVESNDSFIRVGEGKIEGMVLSLTNIDKDHILLGLNEGMYAFDLKKYKESGFFHAKLYNHHNGYLGLEAGQNGTTVDSKGNIWLTSGSVLSVIEPSKLDLQVNPLRPYIEQINNKGVPWDTTKIFDVENRKNDLFLKVGATGFNKSFKTQYSYFVEGESENWSDWQTSNEIALLNLPNGTYNISIKAKTEGLIGEEPNIAKVMVHINAPIWQTPNFYKYASGILAVLSFLIFYFYFRNVLSRKRMKAQELELNYLQVQTLQSQLNPHFLFNALSSLQYLILKNETDKADLNLTRLSKLMRNYLEASVVSNQSPEKGIRNEFSLEKKIELITSYLELEQVQHEDKFDFEINISAAVPLEQITVPPLIIQPHIENAIKHGLVHKDGKGHLKIDFDYHDHTLVCTIEDDGVGREKAAEIKKNSRHSYKSLGTYLVHDRVKLLNKSGYNISIETQDRRGGGTIVTIKIPNRNEY